MRTDRQKATRQADLKLSQEGSESNLPFPFLVIGAALMVMIVVLVGERVFSGLPGWGKDLLQAVLSAVLVTGGMGFVFQHYQSLVSQNRLEINQLSERLHFQRQLMDSFREALIVTRPDGTIIFWNKSAKAIFGYSEKETLGKALDQLLENNIEGQAREQALVRDALEKGSVSSEQQWLKKDGSLIWVSANVSLIRDASGQPAALVGMNLDITDMKQAQLAVQENERQFQSMFHDNQAVMLLFDLAAGKLMDVNPAACDFYGYSRAELLSMKHTDLNTMSAEESCAHLANVAQNGWVHYYTRHRLASSEVRDVEVYGAPFHVNGRKILLILIHDITEQRKAEMALRESERRLWEMMENVRLLAVMANLHGKITFCNEYMAALTGWRKEEITNADWSLFSPKETMEDYENLSRRLMMGTETCAYVERPILTRKGEQRMVALNIIPLRDISGKIIGMSALGADITERSRVEQDMERRMKEMAALQQAGRFITSTPNLGKALAGMVSAARLLLGSQTALVLLHEPACQEFELAAIDGDPIMIGSFGEDRTVLALGERLPDTSGVAGWVLHERQPVLIGDLRKEIGFDLSPDAPPQSLIAVPMIYQGRLIGIFEANNSTLGAFNENSLPVLSMLADFATMAVVNNRLYKAEQEQRRLLEESQAQLIQSEKMNAMGRLVAVLAHEINNPLQSLRSGISLLTETSLSEAKKREYLDVIHREVERLNRTVEQVLGFYRRSKQEQVPIDLHQILDETLVLLEKQLEEANIQVSRDYAPFLQPVDGVPDQLRQVFLNLILNAMEAMPHGGRLALKTGLDAEASQVRIVVQDTGKGIPPEILAKIFEPFYTTRPDGSGLGLSISFSLVEKHQGRIEVQSTLGKGTTFTVILPVHPHPLPVISNGKVN